jgi:hypothetical protein
LSFPGYFQTGATMKSPSVTVRSATVTAPQLVAASSAVVPFSAATNLLNIGPAIDRLLANDQKILAMLEEALENQRGLSAAQGAVALSLSNISGQLQAFAANQVATIGIDVAEIINLIVALTDALANLGTAVGQQAILDLLNTILDELAPKPTTVGLDLEDTSVEGQASPTAPGPSLPPRPTSVGLDLTHTATEKQPDPTKSGP